ncbi:MAG: hypothetical protein M1826_003921 [Phylliscum demangeonii]|nr:MAG: hypothetical protein M1826_003921 [Phylliscum demangeonii]
MVSQAEPLEPSDRTLTLRRLAPPPSLLSARTSTSRRHRQSRSHHHGGSDGGTSSSHHHTQNEFPVFSQTGDVEIVIHAGAGRRERQPQQQQQQQQPRYYLLHRLILAQCSGFFETGTSEEWCGRQREPGVAGYEVAVREAGGVAGSRGRRWRYELDADGVDEIPMLVQKPPSATVFGGEQCSGRPPPPIGNKPAAPPAGFFRTMAHFSAVHLPTTATRTSPSTRALSLSGPRHASTSAAPGPDEHDRETAHDYDNLFRIFYNHRPTLDATHIAHAYVQCKRLLRLAERYDALAVVGPRVDHHLLRFQARLWKQIAQYPASYLKMGYLARSRAIFAEAAVHVVGQWPAAARQLRTQLPDPVRYLIEDKVDDMRERIAAVDAGLFRLTLTTSGRGDRVTPANSYLAWLAVALFRHWLAEHTTSPLLLPPPLKGEEGYQPPSSANSSPAGRVGAYRLLAAGGAAYLGRDELKRFLKLRPEDYSRDNLRRFEQRIDDVKRLARDLARPLMRHHLELELGAAGAGPALPYLTCTVMEERDFPWEDD